MSGRIVADDVQELRERTDITEVIGAHMQLRKAGRILKGLCCFHQEKTPSFTVDPAKGWYHCFGCGAGGDVFTFLQQAEGLTFREAADRLSARLGMTLRTEGVSSGPSEGRAPLLAACKAAAEYYAGLLLNSAEAAAARTYLESRGFSVDDAKHWGLGFSPAGRDTLYRYLLDKKFTSQQIVNAGLAYVSDSGEHRDRFRSRLMFPVSDLSSQIVGFGARTIRSEDQPKYLNSPDGTLYHKSKLLFGLDRARTTMANEALAVVTEGYTDVMGLHKVGVKTAVATCGTALGEEHFALLKRFCDRVILAFDADVAGARASERGFGLHAKLGLEVLVAPLPEGKDPADLALLGAEAVQEVIADAKPLLRFILEREITKHRLDTPEAKAKAVRAVVEFLNWEPSRVARSEHAFWVARRIGVAPEQLMMEIAEQHQTDRGTAPQLAQVRQPGHVKVEKEALAILLDSPSTLKQLVEQLDESHFTDPQHQMVWRALVKTVNEPVSGSVMDVLPDDDARKLVASLSLSPVVTSKAEEVFLRLEQFKLERRIAELRSKLGEPEGGEGPEGGGERMDQDQLFSELMNLDEQRRKIEIEIEGR